MLNSFEIAEALEELGFTIDNDNTHGWGFVGPFSGERIYVKTPKKKFEDVDMLSDSPVKKQPLVLHTSLLQDSKAEFAISSTDPTFNRQYINHNLTWLDDTYQKKGVALNVPSKEALRKLLEECGYLSSFRSSIEDIELEQATLPTEPTERDAVVQARVGQGVFRNGLERIWGARCCVTGVAQPALLRASHIKPWRDSSNRERLDPDNGLLLVANLDAAFDAGLVSFGDNGAIQISTQLTKSDAQAAGIHNDLEISKRLSVAQQQYLQHHRDHIFRK